MPRNLLFLAFVAALVWLGRNICSKLSPGVKAQPARRRAKGSREQPEAVDLVRDEKTGEYRVKEDGG